MKKKKGKQREKFEVFLVFKNSFLQFCFFFKETFPSPKKVVPRLFLRPKAVLSLRRTILKREKKRGSHISFSLSFDPVCHSRRSLSWSVD